MKTKVALGLTKRQLICFSLAAAVGVPVYLFTKSVIGNSAAVLFMIGLMLPFFFLAMFEKDDQPAEKILRNILRARWFFPKVRPYKTENFYNVIEKEGKILANQDKAAGQTGKAAVREHPAGKRR